jgi:SAM-dependent methyltransferase
MLTLRSDQVGVTDRYASRFARARQFIAEHGPLEVFRLVRRHGVAASLAFVLRNLRYLIVIRINRRLDARHNIGDIAPQYLEVVGNNRQHGAAFLSTPVRTFERMLDLLPADMSGFTFVDFGSGKGRVQLLAARRNFRRIIGVEYAPALVRCAERNFATFRDPAQRCRDLVAICADAATYELPPDRCVLYLLRPFDSVVMAAVVENIRRSYAANPRKIYVLLAAPVQPEYDLPLPLFLDSGIFELRRHAVLPFDWGAVTRFQVNLLETRD